MDALGINLPGLITQLVSFAILFAALWMVLYKPISKAMRDRAKKIQDSLESADKAREEADSSREAMEKQISDLRQQVLITEAEHQKTLDKSRAEAMQNDYHCEAQIQQQNFEAVTWAAKVEDNYWSQVDEQVRRV